MESDLSYLCLNREGKFFVFCVLSSAYLAEGYQLALEASLDNSVISELEAKQKMLYFYGRAQDITTENVNSYLLNATQLILGGASYCYGYKEIHYANGAEFFGF